MKSVFEDQGLQFSELTTIQEPGEPPHRQGFVYNPATLQQETSNSELVLPFSSKETLQEWIDKCIEADKNPNAIYGKLYSFPESAIQDFIKSQDSEQEARKTENLGNETYWYVGEPNSDVSERERKKKLFFDKLEKSDQFVALKKSAQLKESEREWNRRVDASS